MEVCVYVYVYVVCGRGCTCLCMSASSYPSLLCCVYIYTLAVWCIRCAQVHSTHPYSHMWNSEVLITLHFNFWFLIEPGACLRPDWLASGHLPSEPTCLNMQPWDYCSWLSCPDSPLSHIPKACSYRLLNKTSKQQQQKYNVMAREGSWFIKCLPIMLETLELQVCATCLSIYILESILCKCWESNSRTCAC